MVRLQGPLIIHSGVLLHLVLTPKMLPTLILLLTSISLVSGTVCVPPEGVSTTLLSSQLTFLLFFGV